MTQSDLQLVLGWRNHPGVRCYMYTQHEIGLEEHRRWFEENSTNSSRHLLIFELNGEPRGFVNFNQLSAGGVADWGFYTAPATSKGSGRQMGYAALDYAFFELKFHKVCGQALAYNSR